MKVIAGDIGGTKTLLCLAEVRDGRPRVLAEARYASADHPGVDAIVARFADEHGARGLPLCLGVAGPVEGDVCRVTNLPWVVDAAQLARALDAPARLVNDFQAAAYGVDCTDQVVTLHEGVEVPRAPRAVVGAGTGLGAALCVWSGDGYEALPTEGGHTDLAAQDDDEEHLVRWLRARHGHVSYERVASGPGLVAVYEHLRERGVAPESPAVRAEMSSDDPAAVVSRHAAAGDDALSGRAFDLFAGVYGAQAGNLALACLARGGIWVAGGIAAKVLPRLVASPFLARVHAKGRMSALVASMPVRVVTDPRVGVLGAALCASRLAR